MNTQNMPATIFVNEEQKRLIINSNTTQISGKYPEDHNINGDIMFDLKTRRFFNREDPNSTHAPFWWQDADPFWSTAAKYGRKVGT